MQAQLAYWKRQLADLPALELPADHPRPAVQTFRGASQGFILPAELCAGLRALSRREETTLFMTLLAAWQTLLARYSGQDDIAVGSPIAGRTHKETEALIGCFLNTLVLRADMSGDPPFREALRRVREVCLDAYAHQDLPFEQIVDALQPARDLSRSPLFQVMFVLQNAPAPDPELPSLALRPLDVEHGTTQFDLSLSATELGAELGGAVEHRTDLFEAPTIARMLGHFQTLLEGIVAAPEQPLADLPLLTEAERRQLLIAWNDTRADYPADGCLHELFAAQAARTPDAIALVFDRGQGSGVRGQGTTPLPPPAGGGTEGGVGTSRQGDKEAGRQGDRRTDSVLSPQSSVLSPQSLTYVELNERANRLAQHLRALGVGPEAPVGVCLERSLELLVALLGVLKAGGVYLPLDPSYPAARLAFMLEDSQAAVVITATGEGDKQTRRQGDKGTESAHDVTVSPLHVVTLSESWPAIARYPADAPSGTLDPANLAYVIYTSGSTGWPKGVMNTHRGIVNRLCWMQDAYRLNGDDVVLQKTSISFDVSVWELVCPLLVGARLVLARPGGQRDSAYLAALIAAERITTLHFVPSMLAVFLDTSRLDECTALRWVICSGEALPPALAMRCRSRLGAELHNLYGPTEAAVEVTAWRCTDTLDETVVPIGRPIANTLCYVLDAHLHPVPIGVAGELHLGGVQLARGYLGRPELTAERFVPNPFGEGMGDGGWGMEDSIPIPHPPSPIPRLYRTGDRARYRPDGAIEFLGRIDEQLKLRGFRIEPGEIESVLRQHADVRECVVMVREDAPGDVRLVAYIVPHREQGTGDRGQESIVSDTASLSPITSHLSPAELRTFLQERLPDYMVPADFVLLDALPLTPNGKLDRRALPAPDRPVSSEAFVAPRTSTEAQLAQIWAEVLRLERVGIHDNFFALGGHSLLATQIVSRVSAELQVELPLQRLFETPTVAGLAEYVEVIRHAAQGLQAPFGFTADDDEGEV